MSEKHFYAAILAGGRGTRLWPQSRAHHPKQFTDITGQGRTMIQATADRMAGLAAADHLYVITGQQYAGLTAEQLPQLPDENILVEPSGRNTAPAIGLACVHLRRRDPEAVVAIFPADHIMTDPEAFRQAVRRSIEAAQDGHLVTLGIEPTEPHTGYGYVQRAELLRDDADQQPIYAVAQFLEKPEITRAQSFLDAGGYYWNGGIFISRVDRLLEEMARQMPETFVRLEEIGAALGSDDAEAILERAWAQMPSESIDYGVMEGAYKVAVTPLAAGWNDVGSWDALDSVLPVNDDGNLIVRSDALTIDSQGNIVVGDGRFIALIGVDDLVVVDTDDALLIGRRQEIQKVKNIVETLKATNRQDLL